MNHQSALNYFLRFKKRNSIKTSLISKPIVIMRQRRIFCAGQIFGDEESCSNDKYHSTIICRENEGELLAIPKDVFISKIASISKNGNKVKEHFRNRQNLMRLHLINNYNAEKEKQTFFNYRSKPSLSITSDRESLKFEKDNEDILKFKLEYSQFVHENRNFEERHNFLSKNLSYDFSNSSKHYRSKCLSEEGKWIKRKNILKASKIVKYDFFKLNS